MAWHVNTLDPSTIKVYRSAVNVLLSAPSVLLNTVMQMVRATKPNGKPMYSANNIQAVLNHHGYYMHPRAVSQAINGLQRGICPAQYRISRKNRGYHKRFIDERGPMAHNIVGTVAQNIPASAPGLAPALAVL